MEDREEEIRIILIIFKVIDFHDGNRAALKKILSLVGSYIFSIEASGSDTRAVTIRNTASPNIAFFSDLNTFTAIVDLSRSNFSIVRTPLFQLKSAM